MILKLRCNWEAVFQKQADQWTQEEKPQDGAVIPEHDSTKMSHDISPQPYLSASIFFLQYHGSVLSHEDLNQRDQLTHHTTI